MTQQFTIMLSQMDKLMAVLDDDLPMTEKIHGFEEFVDQRELWLESLEPSAWTKIDPKLRAAYLEKDQKIQGQVDQLMQAIKENIGGVNEQQRLTQVTKKANQGYLKNAPQQGGYFIDKKK